MITFPCAKINLGLNVVSKRLDGYHDLETVFYPIPILDTLEICLMNPVFPSESGCDIKITGINLCGDERDNLVVKAYDMLKKDFDIPRIHIHLHKKIPVQAGMGGGSSDSAYMIKLLNESFKLGLDNEQMKKYASELGADCAFFIDPKPSYATGKGEILMRDSSLKNVLKGMYLAIIRPDIAISTKKLFSMIVPEKRKKTCADVIKQPVSTWRDELSNDFEKPVSELYPEIVSIKKCLYDEGALYAQMSGTGSAMFGLFDYNPYNIEKLFEGYFTSVIKL